MAANHPARRTLARKRDAALNPVDAATIAKEVAEAKRLGEAEAATLPNKDTRFSAETTDKKRRLTYARLYIPGAPEFFVRCGVSGKDGKDVTYGEAKRRVVATKHLINKLIRCSSNRWGSLKNSLCET